MLIYLKILTSFDLLAKLQIRLSHVYITIEYSTHGVEQSTMT